MRPGRVSLHSVLRAFDESEFGAKNTLNLRETLPSAADARFRAEAWLRERQVGGAAEVLIITGRGNQSPNGVSAVRDAILGLMPTLRRRGVVAEWKEHTPGSVVVKLGSIRSLLEAPRRKRERGAAQEAPNPAQLMNLEPATIQLLRQLAIRSLESLGVRKPDDFVESEMIAKFNSLAAGIKPGLEGEARLRSAIKTALDQLDD
jgi:peptidyl-tRNA hydrolase